jgi:hypothetical protein
MSKVDQIIDAIEKAANDQSKLNTEVLELPSFSSAKIKHLLNNLGAISTCGGEVGTHKGAYAVAANFKNKLDYWVCDNWSEFEQNGESKRIFYENMERYKVGAKVFEQDCFTVDLKQVPKTDLYIYDGNHEYEPTRKGLTYFYEIMEEEFIYCVDDTKWQHIKEAVRDSIQECGLKIIYEQHLWDGKEDGSWWNSFSIFLLKKTK